MQSEKFPEPPPERSVWSLVFVSGLLVAMSMFVVLATAPFADILGPSSHALGGALHGLMAFVFMVVSTIGLYLAWQLFTGKIKAFGDLQLLTTVMATMSFLTIVFGNWIYIAYRASTPDSPRSYFMEHMPAVHKIFFEFKEFAALFTLPLCVVAAFILYRYGQHLLERKWLRVTVSTLIALNFFYFIVAFTLGAAVTKLKSI